MELLPKQEGEKMISLDFANDPVNALGVIFGIIFIYWAYNKLSNADPDDETTLWEELKKDTKKIFKKKR